MWSATWPKSVQSLANDYLKEFYQVTVGSLDLSANKNVTQVVEVCSDMDKYSSLLRYLREHHSTNDRALVFVETKKGCDMLTRSLRADNFQARAIHGDKTQAERDWTLKEFKDGKSTLLVATDVASRGIDVEDVKVVINFDFPKEMESYVHRIGRSGRAGKKGYAVSFFNAEKDGRLARELIDILNRSSQEVPPALQALSSFRPSGKGGGGGGRGRGRRW